VSGAALSAIATDFQPTHEDVKLAVALYLTLKPVEQITLKFSNLSAAQASHVNMIAPRPPLVEVLLALHVH
jgi:hypothetical protein